MMQFDQIELTGNAVQLIPMEKAHAVPLFAASNHPDAWAYMPARVADLADMEQLVSNALSARDAGTEYPFVIVQRSTGEVVGSTRFLDISKPNRSLEIGWTWLTPRVWRTRVNTECKYL